MFYAAIRKGKFTFGPVILASLEKFSEFLTVNEGKTALITLDKTLNCSARSERRLLAQTGHSEHRLRPVWACYEIATISSS
jgi:hypothetical protein